METKVLGFLLFVCFVFKKELNENRGALDLTHIKIYSKGRVIKTGKINN